MSGRYRSLILGCLEVKTLTEEQKEAVRALATPSQMDVEDCCVFFFFFKKSELITPRCVSFEERRCWYRALDRTMESAQKHGAREAGLDTY